MRLLIWMRKPMMAQAVGKTIGALQESDRHETFVRLIEQFESALRRLMAAYLVQGATARTRFKRSLLHFGRPSRIFAKSRASLPGFIASRTT
jgi:hypothetical protein